MYTKHKKVANKRPHMAERALQRYNVYLSKVDINIIVSKVIQGDCLYVRSEGINEFYYVKHKNLPLKILYNPEFRSIITTYPFDTDEYNRLRKLKEENNMEVKIIDNVNNCKAVTVNGELYLRRIDVFLNNNSASSNINIKKCLASLGDSIRLCAGDYPQVFEGSKAYTWSFLKADSLHKLLENGILYNYPEISKHIEDILDTHVQKSPENKIIFQPIDWYNLSQSQVVNGKEPTLNLTTEVPANTPSQEQLFSILSEMSKLSEEALTNAYYTEADYISKLNTKDSIIDKLTEELYKAKTRISLLESDLDALKDIGADNIKLRKELRESSEKLDKVKELFSIRID